MLATYFVLRSDAAGLVTRTGGVFSSSTSTNRFNETDSAPASKTLRNPTKFRLTLSGPYPKSSCACGTSAVHVPPPAGARATLLPSAQSIRTADGEPSTSVENFAPADPA